MAQNMVLFAEKWCRRGELNTRPHHYQWCALPLSYGGSACAGLRPVARRGRFMPQAMAACKRAVGLNFRADYWTAGQFSPGNVG